jgi:hypothetical protein
MLRVGNDHLSWRTFGLIVGGVVALVAFALIGLAITGYLPADRIETARSIVSDVGSIAFGLLAAAFLFLAASRMDPGNPLRRIWLLLGLSVAVYVIGDIIWTVLEVRSGFTEVPYPSYADIAYIAFYVFMAAGLMRAARAFGRVSNTERAIRVDIVLMFLAAIAVYVFVAAPIIVDAEATLAQKVLGVAYPIGDLVVLLGPALFIAFVASSLGRSQAARQWWSLAFGLAVMSLSDILFTWLEWTGRYYSGHQVDYAWMLSLLILAIAGSEAADYADSKVANRATAAAPIGQVNEGHVVIVHSESGTPAV